MEDDENSTLKRNTTSGSQLYVDTKTRTSVQSKLSPKPPERRTSLNWRRRYSLPTALVQKPSTPKRRTSLRWRNSINLQSLLQQEETKISAESNVANGSAPTESQNITPPNNDRLEPSLQISISANDAEPATPPPKSPSNGKTTITTDISASESAPDDWELANFDDLKLSSGSDSDADSEKLKDEEKRIRTQLEAFANECFSIGAGIMPTLAQKPKQVIFDNIKNAELRKLIREIANEVGLEHRTTKTPEGHKRIIVSPPERALAMKAAQSGDVVKSSTPSRKAWIKPVTSAHVANLGCVPGSPSGWARKHLRDIKHVLELTFPPDLTEHHIQQALEEMAPSNTYKIRIIGPTMALLVFQHSDLAQQILRKFRHPFFSLEPLERASSHAAEVAATAGIEAEVRRKKDPSVAKRFIIHALGGMRSIKANNTPPPNDRVPRVLASPSPDNNSDNSPSCDASDTVDAPPPTTTRGRGATHFNPAAWTSR